MKPFTSHTGRVVALDRANVDTDQIIPKQFLKRIERTGYGPNLFDAWRFIDPSGAVASGARRVPNPDFVLNQPRYQGASILLARKNFGCGSSREHAPWALYEYGFRCVIAPSFADIFHTNSLKNGLLPVTLSEAEVDGLFYDCAAFPGFRLVVDLSEQTVATENRAKILLFDIDPFLKYCLLNGLDEIGLTLRHADKIRAYEARHRDEQPWLFR